MKLSPLEPTAISGYTTFSTMVKRKKGKEKGEPCPSSEKGCSHASFTARTGAVPHRTRGACRSMIVGHPTLSDSPASKALTSFWEISPHTSKAQSVRGEGQSGKSTDGMCRVEQNAGRTARERSKAERPVDDSTSPKGNFHR